MQATLATQSRERRPGLSRFVPLAQSEERKTSNLEVAGSNPAGDSCTLFGYASVA